MNIFFRRHLFLILILVSFQISLTAQDHSSKRNEIGIGLGFAKIIHEGGLSPDIHLHYSRTLHEESRFSFLVGLEAIIDDHRHSTVDAGLEYALWKELTLGSTLGLTFVKNGGLEPGVHFEMAYEFELGVIGVGPMVEYGLGPDDSHFMIGVHCGVSF